MVKTSREVLVAETLSGPHVVHIGDLVLNIRESEFLLGTALGSNVTECRLLFVRIAEVNHNPSVIAAVASRNLLHVLFPRI